MKINQIRPSFPDQQPRPLRRLNCVARNRDRENLSARMENYTSIMKASREATYSIISMIRSAVDNQRGALGSNAGISSQIAVRVTMRRLNTSELIMRAMMFNTSFFLSPRDCLPLLPVKRFFRKYGLCAAMLFFFV